jgi:hypothetical protein
LEQQAIDYRTKEFNANIEKHLDIVEKFWDLQENKNELWNEKIQIAYYKYMQNNKFVKGSASRPAKDAREKTSGLVDIGLLTSDRRLTPAGLKLLQISKDKNFAKDNELKIANDSYIYLKQLLKMSVKIDIYTVRPFVLLIYFIAKLNYLSKNEYTYILPLCINKEITDRALVKIKDIRDNKCSIDDFISDTLLLMNNYKEALNLLMSNKITEKLVTVIGINRKSHNYDKPYYMLYKSLFTLCFDNGKNQLLNVYKSIDGLRGKTKSFWNDYIFSSSSIKTLKNNPEKALKRTKLLNSKTEEDFKKEFFNLLHLFKAKATLSDYLDLNRRYFKLTDTILFQDNTVRIDIMPEYFFKENIDNIYKLAFTEDENIQENCLLSEISPYLIFDDKKILRNINKSLNTRYSNIDDFMERVADERLNRFKSLIEKKFTSNMLIKLLEMFEIRKQDVEINNYVTDNADIPTIFEYVIGIIWYKISEQEGNILEYMNLSLDADLLPKSHANGGMADIEYHYNETAVYPKHVVLLEATLTSDSNQRRTEMEPVSRHLGEYLLKHKNENSYCIFLTNYLNLNVISDFRSRKTHIYYSSNGKDSVNSMKIIPLQTLELKTIISKGIVYKQLYSVFDKAHNSDEEPKIWYSKNIKNIFSNLG